MTSPLDLLNERFEEISNRLKQAYINRLPDPELSNMIDYYNLYFIAIQLLESHEDINTLQTIVLVKSSHNSWKYRNLSNFVKKINKLEVKDFSI